MSDAPTRLQALADRQAICDAQARYCRALDTLDFDAIADLLTEDYAVIVPAASLVQPAAGRAAALAHIRMSTQSVRSAVHHVHSPEITIDGDEAEAIWAVFDHLVWEPGDRTAAGWGHYHQRWRREDGKWRLASLRLDRTLMELTPPRWRMDAKGDIVFVEEGD